MFNMRTACDTAHVKSVLRLLQNMLLQHVLSNSLQCGGVSLLTTCFARELNWRLLPKTCFGGVRVFWRSQSTDFMCAVSQAVRILNICKTFHKIQVPLNFLFKFTGINLVLVNIKPVEFHLIRLCSSCNIYMSNDVKFFKTPCSSLKTEARFFETVISDD